MWMRAVTTPKHRKPVMAAHHSLLSSWPAWSEPPLPAYDSWQKTSITAHVPPLPPRCRRDAHIWKLRFSLTVSENYFITKEDEESCLRLAEVPGWLFLERDSRVESFHKRSTLCSLTERKCYVIPGPLLMCVTYQLQKEYSVYFYRPVLCCSWAQPGSYQTHTHH